MLLRSLLLVTLLALAACGGSKPVYTDVVAELPAMFAEVVDEEIDDPERAQVAKNHAIKAAYAFDAYADQAWAIRTQAFELQAEYLPDPALFEEHLSELRVLRAKRQDRVVEATLQAREGLTAEEWSAIQASLAQKIEKRFGLTNGEDR